MILTPVHLSIRRKEGLSHCHLDHYKSHYSGVGLNFGLLCGRPAINPPVLC
jgi:hypothetical protein